MAPSIAGTRHGPVSHRLSLASCRLPGMNNIALQLILRLVDGRVLAPSVPEQRALARSLLQAGRPFGLFLFHTPDTHIHVLVRAAAPRPWSAAGG